MNKPESPKKEVAAAEAPVEDVKTERRAMRAARAGRAELEDHCLEVLDCVRVLNEDGSGKSLDQLRAETKLSEEDLFAALDVLEGQSLISRAMAHDVLVYLACPGIPATPTLVIP